MSNAADICARRIIADNEEGYLSDFTKFPFFVPSARRGYPGAFWHCRRKFHRPTAMDTALQQVYGYSVLSSYYAPRDTIRIFANISSIKSLLAMRNPATVIRVIRAIVVLALNSERIGISVRARPQSERYERRPFLANIYPSIAVPRNVFASMAHGFPDHVKTLVFRTVVLLRHISIIQKRGCA